MSALIMIFNKRGMNLCCLQGEAVPQQERAVRADPEEE